MRRSLFYVLVLSLALFSSVSQGKALRVVASIQPLALLAADIGGDAIEVELLQAPGQSPHDFQLRPSDMKRLAAADLVLWFGPALEHHLERPLRRFSDARALYPDVEPGGVDPHFWLDVAEVVSVTRQITLLLSDRLPLRSAYFHANAARFVSELQAYDRELAASLARSQSVRHLFLHDGFSRLEKRYGLPRGEVVVSAEDQMPGARHLVELRKRLQAGEFSCVFREPQYSRSLLNALTRDVSVVVLELDPLGSDVRKADGFMGLYRQLGSTLQRCFTPIVG
ncbi:zinc ABC transporter substrate-binding protein [Spongiibacter sp. KMU-166]|uniref:High-affinity zinc uptake system protein ZnuA n=1 Tax=Spongiibacter thalassae TaxID=2721624 RepID=A0ABX1GGS7_9GAMM|nr:metal ABC transporter substrate-binding protein [Spongiibacter thalassae]NKI18351.1 zinc ABC transporter substrate-binding protein [Spongiibacter thalassae]